MRSMNSNLSIIRAFEYCGLWVWCGEDCSEEADLLLDVVGEVGGDETWGGGVCVGGWVGVCHFCGGEERAREGN